MFFTRCRYLLHELRRFLDVGDHLLQELAGLFCKLNAARGDRTDFLCSHLTALCELAHFSSDDGESLSVLARPCGFDGSVESEEVGLIRDVVDDPDLLGDALHRGHGRENRFAALGCLGGGFRRDAVCNPRVFRVLRDRCRHLFQGRARLLDACGLLRSGLR